MKTTENSSTTFNDVVKRLFSGMLLGSLFFLTSFNIWAQPTAFEVTGGGSYCVGGEGVPVGLSDSEIGVTYSLFKDNIPQLPTIDGTGEAITFGNQVAGTYSISGTNGDGTTPMTGSAVVIGNPLPETPTITPSGPTTFCAGGSVTLSSSPGTTYLWSNGATTQTIDVTESGSYSVQVTEGNGCQSAPSVETVVTVNPLPEIPTITPSGPTTFCSGSSVTLSSSSGTAYLWSNGATTQVIDVTVPGSYTVQITDGNGCQSAPSAAILITVDQIPTEATIATTPVNYCGTLASGSLGGNTPTVGTGSWSIKSGGTGTFSDGASGSSTFSAATYGTYVLQWTISNGTCTPSSADVTVNYYDSPTTATIATTPLNFCGTLTSGSLGGNTPAIGTGAWSIVSGGTGTFSDGASGSSTFSATTYGTYVLQWTISNGTCTPSSADVTVNYYDSPTTATIATTPLNFCGTLTSGSLGGNTPTVGTGSWSIISGGTGSFSNISGGGSTFTANTIGTYVLRWTISNGTCTPSSADVTVNYYVNFTVSFVTGWNWFSVNTLLPDMSLNSVLSSGFTDGDYIKNQTSFAFYSSTDGWQGSLTIIDPTDLYIIRVQNAASINFCGTPININSTTIPVVTGWNWIGYTPSFSLPLNDALGSLVLVTGDYIKNQTGYADYYGTAWFGSLVNMLPGEGYMMRLTNADDLIYPDSPAKSAPEVKVKTPDDSLSPYKYEFNGSVTADVLIDGISARSEKDRLYAYVDDEIRGIAYGLYLDFQDSYIFPLMIYSNKPEGEIVHFRYYNSEKNKFYECLENILFKTDMIISNPFKSFRMNAVSEKKSAMNDALSDMQLITYPNPFENCLNIQFTLPELTDVRVTVSDQYGNILKVLMDQTLNPDNYTIQWICDEEPAGMYVIRLQTGNKFMVQKVVLIR